MEIRNDGIIVNTSKWTIGNEKKNGNTFKLYKKDKLSDEPVANAIFTLEKEVSPNSQTFAFVTRKATNILGVVEFAGLSNGRYRIKEERPTNVDYQQKLIVEPSDGINDDNYYYFVVNSKRIGRKGNPIHVTAYNDIARPLVEAMMLEQVQDLRFKISLDAHGSYFFADEELVVSDGTIYTGNYYAEKQDDETWKLIENAIGFVPNGQISIQQLPPGNYYLRPLNSMTEQEGLNFQVSPQTRSTFLDYNNHKTYELLKMDENEKTLSAFKMQYNKKSKKGKKHLFVVGVLVLSVSALGFQLKRIWDN